MITLKNLGKVRKTSNKLALKNNFSRVKKLMECGRTVVGGDMDEGDRYIAPTVLADITTSDAIMQEEVILYKINVDRHF